MTAPTYPRINPYVSSEVVYSYGEAFHCLSPAEAQIALRALQDAFAAGQRSMIERKDDDARSKAD